MEVYDSSNNNYENDDLITFQLVSETISLYYSQLTKYSKLIRDSYLFIDVINKFPKEIHKFQEEYQLSTDSIIYFFQLLRQNYNFKDDITLTYTQCVDLLKISKYLKTRKLTDQINEYIKSHSINIDFIIQMIQTDLKTRKNSDNYQIEINQEMENILVNQIDECFLNDKFAELPISSIYRIIEQSYSKSISNDKLFDFIKKSISKFCILFQFLDLQNLSENRLDELCDIYSKSGENAFKYFSYLKCNLNMIDKMNKHAKNLQTQLSSTENQNKEQQSRMSELEIKIDQLQKKQKLSENQNKEQQNRMSEMEAQIEQLQNQLKSSNQEKDKLQNQLKSSDEEKNRIKKQLDDSENIKNQLQKQIEEEKELKGQITANVKSGLLINAQINLNGKEELLDTDKSKYIISTSNSKTLGAKAYEKGEPITKFKLTTIDFVCKAGTYYVRCLVCDRNGKSKELVSNRVMTSGSSVLFGYEGKSTILSLLKGRYKLEVWGAKGGNSSSHIKGGLGGYSCGILTLKENEIIHVFVGGEGQTASSHEGATTSGGFPDGGGTKTGHVSGSTNSPGTGGGSTSIRIKGESVYSRVIVAGGGGGASGTRHNIDYGGFGGGSEGCNCCFCGGIRREGAGTQKGSSGGQGVNTEGDPGTFGEGASGKYHTGWDSGGGGGGGWYGGGSGGCGYDAIYSNCSGGGGGSGWIFTESSFINWKSGDSSNASKYLLSSEYYLDNATSVPGNEGFPRPDGKGNEKGHSGNGYAKITPQ